MFEYKGSVTWINAGVDSTDTSHRTQVAAQVQRYRKWKRSYGNETVFNIGEQPATQGSASWRWRLGTVVPTARGQPSTEAFSFALPVHFNPDRAAAAAANGSASNDVRPLLPEHEDYWTTLSRNPSGSSFSRQFRSPEMQEVQGRLWDYAVNRAIPQAWPRQGSFLVASREYGHRQSMRDLWLTQHDEGYSLASLAVLALSLSKEDASLVPFESIAFDLYGKALTVLRVRLDGLITVGSASLLIRTILCLFSFETISGRHEHARIHLKALRGLVGRLRQEQQTLDPWLAANLLNCDIYLALVSDTSLVFRDTDYDLGVLAKSTDEALGKTTPPYTKPPFTESLRRILQRLTTLRDVDSQMPTSGPPPDDGLTHWLLMSWLSCLHQLTQLRTALSVARDLHSHLYICESLLLWSFMTLGCPSPVLLGRKFLSSVRTRLQCSDPDASKETEDLAEFKPWALLVGNLHSRILPDTDELRDWFESRAPLAGDFNEIGQPAERLGSLPPLGALIDEIVVQGHAYRREDPRANIYTLSAISWRA